MSKHISLLLIALCFLVYGSTIFFDFLAADDIPIIVKGPLIRDFWGSIQTGHIQNVLYTIFYHLFGTSAVPFHLLSVGLHILNTLLLLRLGTHLFNRNIGIAASMVFAVHPLNTEAVSWISASHYLYNAIALQIVLLAYIRYKKSARHKDLLITLALFVAALLFLRSVWLLLIPVVLLITDICILEKRPSIYRFRHLILFIIPVLLHSTVLMGSRVYERVREYQVAEGLNQQQLQPFFESAPYTISTMVQLFVFPHTLQFYYEGSALNRYEYIGMYVVIVVYAGLILYFLKKNRIVGGLLFIPIILLLPALSPVRVAWSMAERYLYSGTLFFCLLSGYIYCAVISSIRFKRWGVYGGILILIIFTGRSIMRVMDFRDTKHISEATLRTSPGSLHAQTDLGMAYIMERNFPKAEMMYYQVLATLPGSFTAAHNLGYMYLQNGLPKETVPQLPYSAEKALARADTYDKQDSFEVAFFYYYQASLKDPNNTLLLKKMVDMYSQVGNDTHTEDLLQQIVQKESTNSTAWFSLFAVAYNSKQYQTAGQYLQKARELEPHNERFLHFQQLLQQRLE